MLRGLQCQKLDPVVSSRSLALFRFPAGPTRVLGSSAPSDPDRRAGLVPVWRIPPVGKSGPRIHSAFGPAFLRKLNPSGANLFQPHGAVCVLTQIFGVLLAAAVSTHQQRAIMVDMMSTTSDPRISGSRQVGEGACATAATLGDAGFGRTAALPSALGRYGCYRLAEGDGAVCPMAAPRRAREFH